MYSGDWSKYLTDRQKAELEFLSHYTGHGTADHNRIELIQRLVELLNLYDQRIKLDGSKPQ